MRIKSPTPSKSISLVFSLFLVFSLSCEGIFHDLDDTTLEEQQETLECSSDQECAEDESCIENTCTKRDDDNINNSTVNNTINGSNDDGECTEDSHCSNGEECVDQRCFPHENNWDCNFDDCDECNEDGECISNQDNSVTDPECTSDGACEAGYECIQNICSWKENYFMIHIEDQTPTENFDRCTDATYGYKTAGAKITSVFLYDSEEVDLGPADITSELGTNTDFNMENGAQNIATDVEAANEILLLTNCPDVAEMFRGDDPEETVTTTFHNQGVYAMGCGGSVTLDFGVPIQEEFRIEISEFGIECSEIYMNFFGAPYMPQETNDFYDVHLCPPDFDPETKSGCLSTNVGSERRTFHIPQDFQ